MTYKRKWLAVLIGLLCIFSFAGCGKQEKEDTNTILYHYGDADITYGEYYIYARTIEEDYQKAYGNGVWSLELTIGDEKQSVKDVTIQDLISDINRVKVLVAQAEEMKVALSDNERAELENQAAAFYSGLTEQDIQEAEISRELVQKVMEENVLAQKVYQKIIADYDFEISEEEARMTTFFDMVFECYEVKKDGTVEEFTEEKKAAQLQRANEALSSLAQDENMTYEMIVDKYNLQYADSYTMAKAELVEEYGESVADKILALSDGEVSTVIQSQYGYHIFKMLQSNNQELTKKNQEEIITQKQKEYFAGIYEEWEKKYDSGFNAEKDVNMKLANRFPFSDSGEQKQEESSE